jgi:cytochrome b subunit of formate dehydrogenase
MAQQSQIKRFSVDRRIEHALLILSFTLLGITGLIQKYSTAGISESLIVFFGGIDSTRIIHRIAATVFLLETIYHLVVMGYKLFVLRGEASMMLSPKDLTDAVQATLHNLGMRKEAPKMGRYNFAEKMEYWALLWGLVVMSITGFMLWNPIATTNVLPGVFIPAAKAAHGAEAVLAVLAIILWHFYHVHIKTFNKSMFTGNMPRHEMEEEHALELEKIETGKVAAAEATPDRAGIARRQKVYFPVAAVISVVLLFLVFRFVTFEETAIATVPPGETAPVVVTQVPTVAPTRVPTATVPVTIDDTPTEEPDQQPTAQTGGGGATTWDGGIDQAFSTSCGACHGVAAMGDFSVSTYADVMKQITPGDSANSKVITVTAGAHPGKFPADVLAQIKAWIDAGAPEK